MKKIKLLTFSASYSFGAMLQCYALCKLLSEMGYNLELIKIPLSKPNYGLIGNISFRINKAFVGKFKGKWLPPLISLADNNIKGDDVYIVGSDQVWNTDLTKDVALEYFFNFLPDNIKRFSYAASFGNTNWNNQTIKQEVADCLQKFFSISVREDTGVDICKEVFNVDAKQVLDPTLLLSSYDELISKKKSKDRLVVFSLLDKKTPEFYELLRFVGAKTNNQPMILGERRIHKKIKNIPWLTVEQWVSNIANSSFVITDSFHCMVFAIMHKKQFIVMPANKKRVGRIRSLLEELGLSNRYYPDTTSIYKTDEWMRPIDYEKVFEKLKELRNNSINFLKSSLEY